VIEIIDICLEENLFNKQLFKKYSILSSPSLQKRYIKGVERRASVELIKEYLLIKTEFIYDNINKDNVNINSINVDNKYTKESIVNDNIENKED
jgi:hypothetical protein